MVISCAWHSRTCNNKIYFICTLLVAPSSILTPFIESFCLCESFSMVLWTLRYSVGGLVEIKTLFFNDSGEGNSVMYSDSGRYSMAPNVLVTIYEKKIHAKSEEWLKSIEKWCILLTLATLAWRSAVRWSSKVITTGYSEAENAFSLIACKQSLSSTGLVRVLKLQTKYIN